MKSSQSQRFGFSKASTLAQKPFRRSAGAIFEALEERKLLTNTLLNLPENVPTITLQPVSSTSLSYNSTTDLLQVLATPVAVKFTGSGTTHGVTTPRSFAINIKVNHNGTLAGGVTGNDLEFDGTVSDGTTTYTGVLLSGEISQFGYDETGTSTNEFDFRFIPSGGKLLSLYSGQDIYVVINASNSASFTSFNTNFTGNPQGSAGTTTPLPRAISLVKLTNGTNNDSAPDGAGDPDGPIVQVGSTVTWTYNVTNTGAVPLTNVVVTDDQPGVTPVATLQADHVHVVGDVNDNGFLDPGETWVFSATGIAVAGQYSNLGTVNATDVGGVPVTSNNPDHYYAAVPEINIIKETNGTNNDTAPGLEVTQGDPITWEYDVTTSDHPGYEPVKNVVVTDDNGTPGNTADDFTPTPVISGGFNVGDTNQNGLLDKGETWVYTATGTAQLGQYTNLATVTGNGNLSNLPVTANNPDNYFGSPVVHVPPPVDITLVKDTDGTNNDSPPVPGTPDGPVVPVGGTVTWTYYVNNPPGNDPLTGIVITDDNGTPGDTSDDLSTTAGSITPVTSGGFNTGDTNQNGILDAGETWVYVATGTATAGQYSNLATVNAYDVNDSTSTVTASNPDHYFGVTPQINIIKYTNGTNNDNPPVAGIPDGPIVPVGSTVTWEYDVTNPGNEPIANVALYDDQIGAVTNLVSGDSNSNGLLDPGETWVYTATGTATLGQYNNNGTVTGTSTISNTLLTANNPDHYFAVNPEIDLVKLTNGTNNDADPIPGTPDGPVVPVGSTVTWTYNVTTAGNEPIANVVVTDNIPGVTPAPVLSGGFNVGDTNQDGLLENGETWVYTASGTAIAGQYSNLGTVTGTSTYSNTPVTSNNPDHYFGSQTAINTVANGPVVLGSGTFLGDTAQLSGGVNPIGSITFTLFNSSSVAVYTDTVNVTNGDGSYDTSTGTNPGGYLPSATGTYTWSATYSGDGSNPGATDNGQNESEVVSPATPGINTSQLPATAVVGSSIADMATITGLVNPSSGDTVTFNLYSNNTASGTPLATSTVTITLGSGGTATATSAGYTAAATGTDYWVATFNGDSNNSTVASGKADEPVSITPATPGINTSQLPATAVVGSSIADMATITGLVNPSSGDTVTFNLYNNNTASGTPLATSTVTITLGSGGTATATSAGYTAAATGTDYWVATFNGDSNNSTVASGKADEPVSITPATPGINTSQLPATAVVGSSIADKATITGLVNPSSGDTVTFNLYNNNTASGTPLATSTVTITLGSGGTATATSAGYTAAATGTDYWVATFNGDSNNSTVASGKADEPVCITKAGPGINTSQLPATAVVGSSIADKATITGLVNPSSGDTVTFNLYSNNTASGTPLATSTVTITLGSGGTATATSAGYTAAATGTDYWVATFNGDSNNSTVASGKADEPVSITPATPGINTSQLPATAVVGSSIADKATITGLVNPSSGDTVTFNLYSNNTASGTPLATSTVTITLGSGGTATATSAGYTAAATGTDYWVATFNGDSNNSTVASGKADEPVSITPATPGINTSQLPATAVVGSSIADKATITGLVNPSSGDTVTFNLYNNNTASGTPLATSTVTITLGSGGTATATSAGYTAAATGTDYWVATFNGDSNNSTVASGKADEPVCITKAGPGINTSQLPATAVVGSSIADKATITGLVNPSSGDTVTFNLYSNNTASGTPLATSTVTITLGSGGTATATSAGYTAAAAGTDYWVATFNGDSNNSTVASGKADEPVCITAPAGSISGIKYFDVTGNGTSSDDTPLNGVTINLYKDVSGNGVYNAGTDTLVATTTTATVNGNVGVYSFSNLPLGKYLVSETVPTGYIQTVPGPTANSGYYAVNLTANGQQVTSQNFDDFMIPTCTPTNVYFVINNCTTVTDLRGNTHEGDTVTAYFTVTPGMSDTLTLVSYTAPDSFFNANDASQQQVFQIDTGTFGPGAHSLTVEIPCSDYQIDFVCGAAINQLGPAGSNIFYSAQQRLISADNEGTEGQCSNFATICGNVYNDLNCDGTFQTGECGLAGTCVTLTGTDDCGNTCTFTRYTDANGCYSFDGLRKGTYKITETTPNGCFDGKDSVGSCGGSASSNDCFSNIKVVYGSCGTSYNFGEVEPAAIDGFTYLDVNNNGLVDRGEGGLANVTVTLTGTNDLSQSVSMTAKTDADGYYAFNNLRPGNYKLVETTPAGYTDGKDTVGSLGGGTATNDTFTSIALSSASDGTNYNFGERKTTSSLSNGSTGSIAFWRNTQGQALIKALNGGSTATNLGNWLATNYPKMYGAQAGIDNLAGKTNAQVAAFYLSQFNGGTNVEPSVMAAALSVYVTNSGLAGTTASSYNFTVNTTGLGAINESVAAANGAAFGTSTTSSTTRTVLQLLTATNSQAVSGSLYNGGASLLTSAYNVYDTIDRSGDVTA